MSTRPPSIFRRSPARNRRWKHTPGIWWVKQRLHGRPFRRLGVIGRRFDYSEVRAPKGAAYSTEAHGFIRYFTLPF